MIVKTETPTELAKEIFWLAWQACGGPRGMGVLQDRSGITREHVWSNVTTRGDYPINATEPDRPYADYVFGRMMKFGLALYQDRIEIMEKELRPDYQSWCVVYPTIPDLVSAAVKSLDGSRQESITE